MYDPAASQATLETQGAEGHKYTCRQAPLIQMLNILLNLPGSLSPPNPTLQTNEDEWLNMKASFKCIMCSFIFSLRVVYLWAWNWSVVLKSLFENVSVKFWMHFEDSLDILTILWRWSIPQSLYPELIQTQDMTTSKLLEVLAFMPVVPCQIISFIIK